MTTNDYKINRQGRIQGGGGTVSVHCTCSSQKIFFHKGETLSFPWKTENHQLHLKFGDLTTCVILDTINVRKCKGSGIISGMKLPAQS